MTQLPPHHHTDRIIRRIERHIEQQTSIISWFNSLLEFLMATNADLMAEIANLKQAVVDDQASDQAVVDSLDAIIAQLKADGDTQAAIDALEDVKAQIKTVSTANPPAPPAP